MPKSLPTGPESPEQTMTFRQILEKHHIEIAPTTHHHSRRGWINFDCPYCGKGTRKWHMGFRERYGYVNCWKCGRHRLAPTVALLLNIHTSQTAKLLKDIYRERDASNTLDEVARPGHLQLPPRIGEMAAAHRNYLEGRQFDPDELKQLWGLQGIGIASRCAWSIFIPIHYHGRMVSWTTRKIGDQSAKYINAKPEEESMPAAELLYGEDYCRHAVCVVEGPADVWRIGPGAVATLGTSFSRDQVLRLAQYPIRAVCFDAGYEAQQRASRLCDQLMGFPGETTNIELEADDPGSASQKEINALRAMVFGDPGQ